MLFILAGVGLTIWAATRGNFWKASLVWIAFIALSVANIAAFGGGRYNASEIFGAANILSMQGQMGNAVGNGLFAYGVAEQQRANTLATNDFILSIGLLIALFRVSLLKNNDNDTKTATHNPTSRYNYENYQSLKFSEETRRKTVPIKSTPTLSMHIKVSGNTVFFDDDLKETEIFIRTQTDTKETLIGKTPVEIKLSKGVYLWTAKNYNLHDSGKLIISAPEIENDTLSQIEATSKPKPESTESVLTLPSNEIDYSDKITKLKQAGEMLKDGLITKEEFERIKNKLIGDS
jgi:hypothetical protein